MSLARFRRLRSHRAGFTIVEVMGATAVMALAIATSVTTMQRGFTAIDTARSLTIASQILQAEVELMRMSNWETVNAYPEQKTVLTVDPALTAIASIGNRFALSRTATNPEAELKEVVFLVEWRTIDGRPLRRTFTTVYGRLGLYDYFYNSAN